MSIVCLKAEACTCLFVNVIVVNCVFEAACCTNYRHCAVSEAHELAEAAGLKARRHKECIAGSIDLMRERFGIVDIRRNLALILISIIAEHILIASFACAKNNYLNSILAELIHNAVNKVEALLVCETGNYTDHHNVGIFIEPKLSLKSKLVLNLFISEVISIEVIFNVLVCFGIKFYIVDTVNDTGENTALCAKQRIKVFTVFGSFDLFCISITNCCNSVSINDTTLEKVNSVVCFKLIGCEIFIGKACDIAKNVLAVDTLELQVVNCHNCADTAEEQITLEAIVEIYGNKTGLPVVTVNDVGAEADNGKSAESCS